MYPATLGQAQGSNVTQEKLSTLAINSLDNSIKRLSILADRLHNVRQNFLGSQPIAESKSTPEECPNGIIDEFRSKQNKLDKIIDFIENVTEDLQRI